MNKSIISNFELIKSATIYLLTYIPLEELNEELHDLKIALNNGNISIQFAVGYVTQSEKMSAEIKLWIDNNKNLNKEFEKIS
jgi:hypothetical protein